MIKYEFKPSFDKSLKLLPLKQKESIKQACLDVLDVLNDARQLKHGLGFKHLKDNYYEARESKATRILFKWVDDSLIFILAGNHQQIKNYLRNNA